MGIYDIYSKRNQPKPEPDVYVYDEVPDPLRVQIHHIITDCFGEDSYHDGFLTECYKHIHRIFQKEYGVFNLGFSSDAKSDLLEFILQSKNVNRVLDVIEMLFRVIDRAVRQKSDYKRHHRSKMSPDEAIEELNLRFKESGVGYTFESGSIIRTDSTLIHAEVTKPSLQLLSSPIFANANEEYLKAHEHYRHGRNKESLTECLKAFESTMKIILKAKGWTYDENDTASRLIKICFDNNLIPQYLQSQLTALRTVLESGVPTVRNKVGGHGQGVQKKEADDELVRYALNLTGSNIIFLVELSSLK